MRVALIDPFIKEHFYRGVGKYARLLSLALRKYTNVDVLNVKLDELPLPVDVYHFPYFDPFVLSLPLFYQNKPTVITIHDLIPIKFPQHFPRGIRGELIWQIQKRLVKRANIFITDSSTSADDIHTILKIDKSRIHIIPLAADELFYTQKTTAELDKIRNNFSLPKDFVLYVGDVNWNKNIPNLIKACIQTDLHLVIVSRAFAQIDPNSYNPWQNDLREAIKLMSNTKLARVLSNISDSELCGLYKAAKILILPSLYEGFGLPIVEGFASGCPVITSRRGSIEEVAGDAAFYIDPVDISSIKAGLIKLFSDLSLRQTLIARGKQRVKKFNWNKTAQSTVKAYQTAVNTK